jgi:hypothetical protein
MYYLYDTEAKAITNEAAIRANIGDVKWANIEYFDALDQWGFNRPKTDISGSYTYSQIIDGIEYDDELEYSNNWHLSLDS